MSTPFVSFVVPCYNYARYLPACLDGIAGQLGGYSIEIIAIDDKSTDNTLELLRARSDARLRVISHDVNRGHVYTVNEGLAAATGTYVVRVDPDDRHRPEFLVRTVPILERHAEVGLVYGDVALIDSDGNVTKARTDEIHGGRDFKGNELIPLLKRNFICAPAVIARREAWMQAWPIPSGLAFNDWYFNVMLARRWEFAYVDEVLAEYRVHDANHHARVSRDGSEERSVLEILDRVYSECEADPRLERAKRDARASVYAGQYLDFATKYFGHGDSRSARRCFVQAARYAPSVLLRRNVARHLVGSTLPRGWYDALKRLQPGG